MGWALKNLSAEARANIARQCFIVDENASQEKGAWLNGLCPFHTDENPSFGYNIDEDVYVCLASCVDSGDLIDLWCLTNGYKVKSKDGFNAFRRKFGTEMGIGAPERKTPGQERRKERNAEKAPQKTITEDVYACFAPIPDAMAAELRLRRGWTRETIEKLGLRLLDHYRKSTSLYKTFPIKERDRVVIPIRGDDGTLYNLRTYYPFGKPAEAPAKILAWGNGHGSARLFPNPSQLRPGPVLLCEGEPDCICAISNGFNAVTQTSKTTHWPVDQLQALAGRDVVIAYDADKAGQDFARKAAKSLHAAGVRTHTSVVV